MLYIIKLNFKIINAKFVRNVDETFYFILFYLLGSWWEPSKKDLYEF